MSTAPRPSSRVGPARGIAQSGVRVVNERTVLTLVARHPGSSNADLARISGLGPQTTSRILADLEERHLIRRGDVLRGRRGQPATPIFLEADAAYAVGITLGWRVIDVVLTDFTGAVRHTVARTHAWPDAETAFDIITTLTDELCDRLSPDQRQRVAGIGLAAPVSIARHIEQLGAPPRQKELWSRLDVASRASDALHRPVRFVNDGTAACFAGYSDLSVPRPLTAAAFYVGSFVGGGVVADGRLWEGPSGNAADVGAVLVSNTAGRPAFLHQVASLRAFDAMLREDGIELPPGPRTGWDWASLEPTVGRWLHQAGLALAQASLTMQAVVEADTALIDGALPPEILARLGDSIERHLLGLPALHRDRPTLALGRRGGLAPAIGAARLVMFHAYYAREWSQLAIE